MGVDLDQPVAVGHLYANAEIVSGADSGHSSACRGDDWRAVRGDDVDAQMEVEVAVVGRLKLE